MIARYTMPVVEEVIVVIELIGVAVITVGALWAIARFLLSLTRKGDHVETFGAFRTDLGRSIILGLEFLVAADIIHTVVIDLSLESVVSLAAIVFIRVVLSFSLEAEIDGRWPWQRGKREKD